MTRTVNIHLLPSFKFLKRKKGLVEAAKQNYMIQKKEFKRQNEAKRI